MIFGGVCFLFLRKSHRYPRWGNSCAGCFIALLTNLSQELAYSVRAISLTFTIFPLGVFQGYLFYNFLLKTLSNVSSI